MSSFRRILWTAALALLIAGAGMAGSAAAQETAQTAKEAAKEAAQTTTKATAKPVPLTGAQKAQLRRVEDYLNELKTLQARFIQVSQRGQVAEGDLYLQRPGKVRFEYDPPVPILIVSSGLVLYYFDKEREQTTQVFVRTTPVGILVAEKLSFTDDVTVSHFAQRAGTIRITVQRTGDPEEGAITLVFNDKPLTLRQWVVLDAQGQQTSVTLTNVRTGHPLDPKLFRFDVPEERE